MDQYVNRASIIYHDRGDGHRHEDRAMEDAKNDNFGHDTLSSLGSSSSVIGLANVNADIDNDGEDKRIHVNLRPIQLCINDGCSVDEEIQQQPYDCLDSIIVSSKMDRQREFRACHSTRQSIKYNSLLSWPMLLLTLMSSLIPVVRSRCNFYYAYTCSGKDISHTLSFNVNSGSSSSSGYEATATWSWVPGDGIESITDMYSYGSTHNHTSFHSYESTGYYKVRYTLHFGEGADGCTGTYEQLGLLNIADNRCTFQELTELKAIAAPMLTPSPTPLEINFPLFFPSNAPIVSPTKEPTNVPSLPPSEAPTYVPTKTPTRAPTASPATESPSRSHVAGPEPTYSPTVSISPSPFPSAAPSTSPSSSLPSIPSPSTSLPPTVQIYSVPTIITLHTTSGQMNDQVLETWVTGMSSRIKKHIEEYATMEGAPEIMVDVLLNDVVQKVLDGDKRSLRKNTSITMNNVLNRKLQLDKPLQIEFTTTLFFQSTHTNYNLNKMVASGFESSAKQRQYIYSLKGENDFFEPVESITMMVGGIIVTEDGVVILSATTRGGLIYYAIGGVVGGILLLGGYYLKKKIRWHADQTDGVVRSDEMMHHTSSNGGGEHNANSSNVGTSTGNSHPGSVLTPETSDFGTIEMKSGEFDDVSTLMEPSISEAYPSGMVGDDTVADSVFSSGGKLYGYGVGRQPHINTETSSKMDSSYTETTDNQTKHIFGDDDTLENIYHNTNTKEQQHISPYDNNDFKRITVVAPAGKLGMLVDNPDGDIPFVHAIKETSVLHGRVNVGDFLLSVDEQDCRGMSATAVSKLIGSRSENPKRTLVLLSVTMII